MTAFNGWKNHNTWLMATWLCIDKALHEYWFQQAKRYPIGRKADEMLAGGLISARELAANQLAEQLRWELTKMSPIREPNVYTDLLNSALTEVDWFEIAWDIWGNLPGVWRLR